MKFRSFVFERDMAEEAHLRAQGWKLKGTDHAYRMSHNMLLFGPRWKVCRSTFDVVAYFLRSFAYYITANIQNLMESGQEPRSQKESHCCSKKTGNGDTGGCTL